MNWFDWLWLSALFGRRSRSLERLGTVFWVAVYVGSLATIFATVSDWFGRSAAFGAAGGVVLAVLIGFVLAMFGERQRDHDWHWDGSDPCVRCGYDLRANQTTRCPECGTPCIAHRRHREPPASRKSAGNGE